MCSILNFVRFFLDEMTKIKISYLGVMSNSLGIPVITVNQPKVKDKPAK